MTITEAQERVRKWAAQQPFLRKVYFFGSRVAGNHSGSSDLDIAIEFDPIGNYRNCDTTWICEGDQWAKELQELLPWRVQLEYHDPAGSTPTVSRGLEERNIVVYERAT